jgi:predicted TIM-barrel enzyme
VKDSAPLGDRFLGDEVEDTVERALADAVIVSGTSTGKPTALEDGQTPRRPSTRLCRSGLDDSSVEALREVADRAIIGTAFKLGDKVSAPLTEHAFLRWSQPYGGGLLAKR